MYDKRKILLIKTFKRLSDKRQLEFLDIGAVLNRAQALENDPMPGIRVAYNKSQVTVMPHRKIEPYGLDSSS